jgi:hypothetical protein
MTKRQIISFPWEIGEEIRRWRSLQDKNSGKTSQSVAFANPLTYLNLFNIQRLVPVKLKAGS